MTECFFLDGPLPVHLPAGPGSSPSHTEPYLSLVMPYDGGTRRLALPTAREGPEPDPASAPDWVLI